jgi:hypothetical protein
MYKVGADLVSYEEAYEQTIQQFLVRANLTGPWFFFIWRIYLGHLRWQQMVSWRNIAYAWLIHVVYFRCFHSRHACCPSTSRLSVKRTSSLFHKGLLSEYLGLYHSLYCNGKNGDAGVDNPMASAGWFDFSQRTLKVKLDSFSTNTDNDS